MDETTKQFGLDTEGCNREPGWPTRTIQIYSPTKKKTLVLHRAPGQENWRIIWVDIEGAMNDPVDENGGKYIERTDNWMATESVRKFLTDPKHGFITQNGYHDDFHLQRDVGVRPNIVGDSFVYGIMLPTGPQVSKSLQNLMARYVDGDYDKNRWGSWEDHEWGTQELEDGAILYCAFDPYASYMIETTLKAEYPRYNNNVYQLEMDLVEVLTGMRLRGVPVDEEGFAMALFEYRQKVAGLQQKLNEEAGFVLRVGSTKDLGEYLYDTLKLPCYVWTKGGEKGKRTRSTAKDALAYLTHPVVDLIIELKEATNILSQLEKMWVSDMGERKEVNGRKIRVFHPTFKPLSESQASRIYTENPSVNQWTWAMRAQVVPPQGGAFVYADISAFELILAAYSGGQDDMIKSYLNGNDLHRDEAAKIFGGKSEEITDTQRESTKTVEYATIFGSEGASVARKLRCPIEDAQHLCFRFMEVNDRIRALRDRIHNQVMKSGIANTPFGRCRRIPEVFSHLGSIQDSGKRKAWNTWCQSGAADIAKQALVWLHRNLPPEYKLFFPVFDSVTFTVPDMDPIHLKKINYYMAAAFNISFKGQVWRFLHKAGQGVNWKAAKEACDKSKVVLFPEWQPEETAV